MGCPTDRDGSPLRTVTVLVLEDPGGVPLDQLLGQPLDLALFVASGYQPFDCDRSLASARHYPQGHQAGQCSGELRYRPVLADGVWYRFAASTRAPVCQNLPSLSPGHSPTWRPSRPDE